MHNMNQKSLLNIKGDVVFPEQWTVFGPLDRRDPLLPPEVLRSVPAAITVSGKVIQARTVKPTRGQYDFRSICGVPPHGFEKTAYVFLSLHVESEMEVTLGLGWNYWLDAWLNGVPLPDITDAIDAVYPPAITNRLVGAHLLRGENILALRHIGGYGAPVLAVGGPHELRAGDFRCIVEDPRIYDPVWSRDEPRAMPGSKTSVDIGTRRELFVDDFLVDGLAGGARRVLHHPVPREIVLRMDKPWEGNASGYAALVQDAGRILIYYNNLHSERRKKEPQSACVAESADGIHFTRPNLGLIEFQGSTANNMVWRRGKSGHNFTPFKDLNPDVSADQVFKALAYHPDGGGLGAYVSPDGLHWKMLVENKVITQGGFDSQNLAFWDPLRGLYIAYCRRGRNQLPGHMDSGTRDIITCVSEDFIHWTEPRYIEYDDDRVYHMYTNCIQPYFRAPHIYIGTPARFISGRRKVAAHPHSGVSDALLMSSRDGIRFCRWADAFIRPGMEPEVWTERNNYPSWGIVQTSPEEMSLYWTEHFRHPGMCLRRGTLRTDGFVSVHAGGADIGELLTRPMVFAGRHLEINYATSAAGTMLFELCNEAGQAIPGFAFADSETLYGNALKHLVTWRGVVSDLGAMAGRPVRLRVRLQDADMYALRFC